MKPIQIILVPSLILLMLAYFAYFRSRLFDRAIVLLVGVVGITMVAVPNLAQTLALLLGVGRGTDLIMYVGLIGLSFICLLFFARLRELEKLITDIVRRETLRHPHHPNQKSEP